MGNYNDNGIMPYDNYIDQNSQEDEENIPDYQ
jgi:hypothetical protein